MQYWSKDLFKADERREAFPSPFSVVFSSEGKKQKKKEKKRKKFSLPSDSLKVLK